jgi:hypothetical protein
MFLIRETETGAFCTGQGFRSFSMDMQLAAQFVSRANAEKAIKNMFKGEKIGLQWNTWSIDDKRYHPTLQAYIDQMTTPTSDTSYIRETYTEKTCVMEVVEVKLVLV